MKEHSVLQQKDLDALLTLLSSDREEAGKVYEDLRKGLIRFFASKGCYDSFDLADETLTRVATKAFAFDNSLNIKPSSFVYGFASRVYLEYSRSPRKRVVEFDPAIHSSSTEPMVTEDEDAALICLEECLAKHSAEERSLIIRYYSKERHEKIELRKRLAEELNCRPEVLHMRIHRMRAALKACVSKCIAKKG